MGAQLTWEQGLSWLVLLFVLIAVVGGRPRFDIAAFSGLLFLGLFEFTTPAQLFSGFSSPALFTVAAVLVLSAGIVESGILKGLGLAIARRVKKPQGQILSLAVVTGLLSAFMNNVGAVGILLPTAQRMADRAVTARGVFGMPMVYASILGGSVTLIGTASNVIVSIYRLQAYGKPFSMFDYTAHGLVMLGSGLFLWFVCRLCGYNPLRQKGIVRNIAIDSIQDSIQDSAQDTARVDGLRVDDLVPFARSKRRRKLFLVGGILLTAILLTSSGVVHPSVGFGMAVLGLIGGSILKIDKAYQALNLPVLIFLGSMLSIARILEETEAIALLINRIMPLLQKQPPFMLILLVLMTAALLANILDNSVAAVLMCPTVIALAQTGLLAVHPDALLMAVAAGSSLGLVLPTHQVTMVGMTGTGFSPKSFIKAGAVIAITAGVLAALTITMIWN